MTNQLRIDFASNPALAELFSDAKVGDSVSVETSFIVTEKTEERIVGTIKKVVGEGNEDEPATPSPDEPMMMEMSEAPETRE